MTVGASFLLSVVGSLVATRIAAVAHGRPVGDGACPKPP